jgi:hypothetical protein
LDRAYWEQKREGIVIKENDHFMDCFRMAHKCGHLIARTKPVKTLPKSTSTVVSQRAGY